MKSDEPSIVSLENELIMQMSQDEQDAEKDGNRRKIIIMGDKMIPFTLLKKVMYTCSWAGYQTLSLAVIQKE